MGLALYHDFIKDSFQVAARQLIGVKDRKCGNFGCLISDKRMGGEQVANNESKQPCSKPPPKTLKSDVTVRATIATGPDHQFKQAYHHPLSRNPNL